MNLQIVYMRGELGEFWGECELSPEILQFIYYFGARYILKDKSGQRLTKSRYELIRADDDDPDGDNFKAPVLKSSRLYTINT